MESLELVGISLKTGNSAKMREAITLALEAGVTHKEVLTYMLEIMADVGYKFKNNQLFVPEVLIIGRAFNIALDCIGPLLEPADQYKGIVVIGTIKGDLHDIGKNLVKLLMGSTGMKVIDLGVDVSAEQFVQAVKDYKPDILAMSALLTTTMVQLAKTIRALEKEGLRDQVKIIIGGAPVTASYAKNIKADYYAPDAGSAAEIVSKILPKIKSNDYNDLDLSGTIITD